MITQKHGRKLASQLGEVLFVCQLYDLQIETKVSLSLRNFVVALSVCLSFLFTKALHIPLLLGEVPIANVGGHWNKKQGNRHTQDTNNISITDWILVQGNLGKNRLGTWEDVGVHSLGLLAIESFRLV